MPSGVGGIAYDATDVIQFKFSGLMSLLDIHDIPSNIRDTR
jgi:hypothetical protein